ncbi:MAG: hypothetical protein AABX12_03430 [Nanoarchaeota archaeon]
MEAIEARIIIEMLGRPAEHLSATLNSLIERLGAEKGVAIKQKKVYDPVPVKDSNDLFSTFVELEITFDSLNVLLGILFAYMPSNVEVMSPQQMKFSRDDISALSNNLVARLHAYDAAAKNIIAQRDIAFNQLRQLIAQHPELRDELIKHQQQAVPPSEANKSVKKKGKKKTKRARA